MFADGDVYDCTTRIYLHESLEWVAQGGHAMNTDFNCCGLAESASSLRAPTCRIVRQPRGSEMVSHLCPSLAITIWRTCSNCGCENIPIRWQLKPSPLWFCPDILHLLLLFLIFLGIILAILPLKALMPITKLALHQPQLLS